MTIFEVMKAIVSVIIPAFNEQRNIARAIKSVLAQSFCDFELIVVDDASTDGTLATVESLAATDSRISVIVHDTNHGLSQSRLNGVKAAQGEYVFFLDADDYITPEALELLTDKAYSTQCDIIIAGAQRMSRRLHIPMPFLIPSRILTNEIYSTRSLLPLMLDKISFPLNAWGRLYRRTLLAENFICAEKNFMGEDMILNIRVFAADARLAWIDNNIYHWTMGGGSSHSPKQSWQHNLDLYYRCREVLNQLNEHTPQNLAALDNGLKNDLITSTARMLGNPLKSRTKTLEWVGQQLPHTHLAGLTSDDIVTEARRHLSRHCRFYLAVQLLSRL